MQLTETPMVTTDGNGHHVKDTDGNTVQSFPKTPEGLKSANEYKNKNFQKLNVSQKELAQQQQEFQQAIPATEDIKRDNDMTDLEKMYKEALNEAVTITSNSSDDPSEENTVKINAQDASPDEILDMLKMAGIDSTPEPAYQEVEFEPELEINPVDDMAGMISIMDIDDEPCGCGMDGCDMDAEVEEDYANAPDEVYGNADLQMSMAGGPNRPSNAYKHVSGGDNPMALEEEMGSRTLTPEKARRVISMKIYDADEHMTISGGLNLTDTGLTVLPNNLTVNGSLRIARNPIKQLPENLTVNGDLILRNTNIKELPSTLSVSGEIYGDIDFIDNRLSNELPNDMKVDGDLDIKDKSIPTLPKNMKVGEDIADITRLAEELMQEYNSEANEKLDEMDPVGMPNLKFPNASEEADRMEPTKTSVSKMSKGELRKASTDAIDPKGQPLSSSDAEDAQRELDRRQQERFTKKPWKASTPFTGEFAEDVADITKLAGI